MNKSYHKLKMWQLANELVKCVYLNSEEYPKHEIYGLTSQLRRAALSGVLNIVEGHARKSKIEFRRFLDISMGSLAEVEYLLELSLSLGYLDKDSYSKVEEIRTECGKLIWSYREKVGKP